MKKNGFLGYYYGMKILLRKRTAKLLVLLWSEDVVLWESGLEEWFRFPVKLPRFYREVSLAVQTGGLPEMLTVECARSCGWAAVFYQYNLREDMQKYMEKTIDGHIDKMPYFMDAIAEGGG